MPKNSQIHTLIDHLFRHESGKIIAVLTRIFGTHNLELAEDVVQDTLLDAMNVWSYKGVPENQTAWLYKVAKNKALNIINREKYKKEYTSDVAHFLKSEWTATSALEQLFSEQEIQDDQLRMMFTCCHPSISPDSQVALTLKTLCGFSIPEIAKAFLTTEDTVNKRLVRARQKMREEKISFQVPEGDQLRKRLERVLETIYLLFNEGYSASKGDELIRHDLCSEAIRLAEMAANHPVLKNESNIHALLSLMFLNASRFIARQDEQGNIVLLAEQDRSLWDSALIEKGFFYFNKSIHEKQLSVYHILATISACHCSAKTFDETDWKQILELYDRLLSFDSSPLVLLNRTVVIEKVKGSKIALGELEKIKESPSLKSYYLFYSTQGEFYRNEKYFDKAIQSFSKAIELCPLEAEKNLLRRKLKACKS